MKEAYADEEIWGSRGWVSSGVRTRALGTREHQLYSIYVEKRTSVRSAEDGNLIGIPEEFFPGLPPLPASFHPEFERFHGGGPSRPPSSFPGS